MDIIKEIGEYIDEIPNYPLLHIVHCLATTASIRSQPGALDFAHDHPLASLAGNTMIINAGGILVSAALGKPLIGPFCNVPLMITAIFVWWLVYFAPGDIAFRLYKIKPIQTMLMTVRETRRCKKVLWAVSSAAAVYEGQWIPLILVGALGGCSGKFLQNTEESIRLGSAVISKGEFLQISFVTKASLLVSGILSMIKIGVVPFSLSHGLVFCSVILVTVNLAMALAGLPDPFHPITNATWKVCSIAAKRSPDENAQQKEQCNNEKKDK